MKNGLVRIIGISTLLLAVLLLAACGGETGGGDNTDDGAGDVPPVVIDDFAVIAEGVLLPRDFVEIGFLQTGYIVEVMVEEGDVVQAGDVLARLEDSQRLAAQLQGNRLELLDAREALDALQDETTYLLAAAQARDDLALAEDQLDRAQRDLNNLLNPDIEYYEDQVELAQDSIDNLDDQTVLIELQQAGEAYYFAQEAYNEILDDYNAVVTAIENCDTSNEDPNCDPNRIITVDRIRWTLEDVTDALNDAADQLRQAELVLEQARRNNDNALDDAQDRLEDALEDLDAALEDPDPLDVALREAEVTRWEAAIVDAQDRLDDALAGPDPDDVRLLEARIAAAEAAITATEDALGQLELVAPIDGTVAALGLKFGEQVIAGTPVVTLADFTGWIVETDNLTEIEVVRVAGGQPVTVVLDALPDVELAGAVREIDTVFIEKRGDVTYTVTIDLADDDAAMRWGMTAVVTFDE